MLIIFTRAIIVYIFLLVAMRLMGKKQLGELQPFEFAISLIVADLACIPMSDTGVPITYGLIPIFTLFVLHFVVTKLLKHSIKLRGVINGNPVIVINSNGIDYNMLKSLDMTINDLLEALRGTGYFSPDEVEYAIVETNGNLTVLPKSENSPITMGDIQKDSKSSLESTEKTLPTTLITEGKLLEDNLKECKIDTQDIDKILKKYNLKVGKVLLLTIENDKIFLQPKGKKAISTTLDEVGL